MNRKLKVTYDSNICVGNANCAAIDPDHFSMKQSKAVLADAKKSNGLSVLEESFSKSHAKAIIEAAHACPVNAITVVDLDTNETIIGDIIKTDHARELSAQYDDSKEFVLDPCGYFLIRIHREKKSIEVAFCNGKNNVVLKVNGKKPIDIYQTIINKESLDIRKDHAAYLGRELQKAYIALKHDLEYVQDDELEFS